MPRIPVNPLYAPIRPALRGLLPGGSFDVYLPDGLTPRGRQKFRAAVASRVVLYRRDLPAGYEFSIRRFYPDRLTITRLDGPAALARSRAAAIRAATSLHDVTHAVVVADPYPLRVQPNGLHRGTVDFDHLSPPRATGGPTAREPHRRALRAALLKLEPGGTFTWPLPPAVNGGYLLAGERRWLARFIDLHRARYAPDLAVVVGLNAGKDGLLVRRRAMVELAA